MRLAGRITLNPTVQVELSSLLCVKITLLTHFSLIFEYNFMTRNKANLGTERSVMLL